MNWQDYIGFVALLLLITGIVVFFAGMLSKNLSRLNIEWKKTRGRVVEARAYGGKYGRYGKNWDYFVPEVTVSYIVDGQKHESSRTSPFPQDIKFENTYKNDMARDAEEAIRKVQREYPTGTEVDVYYDSTDPSYGVINPKVSVTRQHNLGSANRVGIALIILGGIALVWRFMA